MLRKGRRVVKASKAYGLLKTSLKYQTKEFFENSTLHGVRYVAEKGRPFTEKFMWFCLVAVGAVAAFVIIGSLWEKFQTNPTITGTFAFCKVVFLYAFELFSFS
jgi:Amiloride-sensitive sodium channel